MLKFDKNKIKALRREHNLSLYQFGIRLGTSKQRVHQWEVGISKPQIKAIERMCSVFGVIPGYFFVNN